jgi:hypothetical protein
MKLLLAYLLVLIPFTVHAEYLGNLSANEFDQDSIANPFGAGNPFSSNSVTNEFGVYGNPFSVQSATNPYATETPQLYGQQGAYRGTLSTNQYDPDTVCEQSLRTLRKSLFSRIPQQSVWRRESISHRQPQ